MGPDKVSKGVAKPSGIMSHLEQKVKYHAGKTFGKYYPSANRDKRVIMGTPKSPGGAKPGPIARLSASARLNDRGIKAKVSPGKVVNKPITSSGAIAKRKGPAVAAALGAGAKVKSLQTVWLGRKARTPKHSKVNLAGFKDLGPSPRR